MVPRQLPTNSPPAPTLLRLVTAAWIGRSLGSLYIWLVMLQGGMVAGPDLEPRRLTSDRRHRCTAGHDGVRFYTGREGTKPGSESMQDLRNPVATIPRAAIGGSNRSHGLNISSHRWEKVLTRRLEFTAGEDAAAEQLGRATRGSRLVYAARRGENSGKVAPQRPCGGSGGDFVSSG
jgi:hypothetical protein